MTFFFVKAIPPRPTFAADMTETERNVMHEHVAYWTEQAERGTAIVFGPVLDPKVVYGILIAEVKDEAELRNLIANDPAVKAGILRDEFYLMGPSSIVRK